MSRRVRGRPGRSARRSAWPAPHGPHRPRPALLVVATAGNGHDTAPRPANCAGVVAEPVTPTGGGAFGQGGMGALALAAARRRKYLWEAHAA